MPYPSKLDPAAIASVGLQVVEDVGWHGWSLREVAGRLDVAPNALYRHVADREGLALAIGAAAAGEVRAVIADAEGDDPVDRLVDMAERYLRFAAERPDAYEAFVRGKPDRTLHDITPWDECWVIVVEAVAAAVPEAAEACGFALWSSLHGRADLTRGPAVTVDARWGIEAAVRALVAGFRDAGPLPSPLEPPPGG
ncbi:MAG: WHG domain-containing protein [Actinomycetota bacterium]